MHGNMANHIDMSHEQAHATPLASEKRDNTREIFKESRKEWRAYLTKKKLAEAKPGEKISFTGVALEGVHYASMLAPADAMLHRGLKNTENAIAGFLERTGSSIFGT